MDSLIHDALKDKCSGSRTFTGEGKDSREIIVSKLSDLLDPFAATTVNCRLGI